jgi:hypothetical protein
MSEPAFPPAAPPIKAAYSIPPAILRGMVLTLARPPADAPESAWQEVVQAGLDALGAFDPRDAIEAMLAIQVIAANAGMLDAYRLAFEPGTTAAQAMRQRASATSLGRGVTGAMRLLTQQRALPAAPARDWGSAVDAAAAWRAEPPRPAEPPQSGKPGEAEPQVIVKWIDEIDDAELAIAVEEERREKAGEPPLPRSGPKVLYRYKTSCPFPGPEGVTRLIMCR